MIVLLPHIEKSIKALNQFADKYNSQHAEEWNSTNDYKKKSFKTTYRRTAEALIRAFYCHQLKLSRTQIVPDPAAMLFRTDNHIISTMLSCDRSTAYRHIKYLMQAGVITEKQFRGTHASYAIDINPEILVAAECPEYYRYLEQKYMDEHNKTELNAEELSTIYKNAKPSFSVFKNGIVATCNLKRDNKNLQDHNNNMNKVSFFDNLVNGSENQLNTVNKLSKNDVNNNAPTSHFTQEHQTVKPKNEQTDFSLIVLLAWNFAKSVLWPAAKFHEIEIYPALQHILYFFSGAGGNKTTNQARFTMFCERVLIAKRYRDRSPERFIPNPATWFDPSFEHGFSGTKEWFYAIIKRRQKQAEYYANAKLLAQLYRIYSQTPSLENYAKALSILQKKNDKTLTEIFNLCVDNQREFTHELFNEYSQYLAA